jgi:hypothetical protein
VIALILAKGHSVGAEHDGHFLQSFDYRSMVSTTFFCVVPLLRGVAQGPLLSSPEFSLVYQEVLQIMNDTQLAPTRNDSRSFVWGNKYATDLCLNSYLRTVL